MKQWKEYTHDMHTEDSSLSAPEGEGPVERQQRLRKEAKEGKIVRFDIRGQVRGGKNNMLVLKNGMHIPNKAFVKWKKLVMPQIEEQFKGYSMITDRNYKWVFRYTPGDLRRRDMPAILDAIFHVFEKCEVVEDDCMIKDADYKELALNREEPRIEITAIKL